MGSRLAYLMTVLFVGISLAMIGQIDRVEAGRSYRGVIGHANMTSTAANATVPSLDESKLKLKICVGNDGCTYNGGVGLIDDCVCCLTLPGAPCFYSHEDCEAACPVCDPDCPTYPPSGKLQA
ncbi:unnamed protein product [Alopecurus aequalis]